MWYRIVDALFAIVHYALILLGAIFLAGLVTMAIHGQEAGRGAGSTSGGQGRDTPSASGGSLETGLIPGTRIPYTLLPPPRGKIGLVQQQPPPPIKEEPPLTGVDTTKGIGQEDRLQLGPQIVEQCPGPGPCPTPTPLKLPEDADRPHIVVVGDESYQSAARAAIAKIPEAEGFHVGYYVPGNFLVDAVKYRRGITIVGSRDPNGRGQVIHYQEDLAGLDRPVQLAAGKLRRPDPAIDGVKLPDLRRISLPLVGLSLAPLVGTILLGAAAVVALILISRS